MYHVSVISVLMTLGKKDLLIKKQHISILQYI